MVTGGMPDGAESGQLDGRLDDRTIEDDVRTPRLSGVDLARTALQAARRTARTAGTAPAKKRPPTAREAARLGRTAREPSAIAGILTALADASGWATGTARGALHDTWATIVGEQSARHWKLAGFDAATSTLRILADTPAWATQLRLHQTSVLHRLEQHLPPGAVRALDIRIGRTSGAAVGPDDDLDDTPVYTPPTSCPTPPAASSVYRQLREQMSMATTGRRAARQEEAALREELLRLYYNRLREPEGAHRLPVDEAARGTAHEREQRHRHLAALAVARAGRRAQTTGANRTTTHTLADRPR